MQQSSLAWTQFLLGKRQMLSEYRRAREHARNLLVPITHGVTGEAAFREWLETFLPRRFGVTPGYIRGQHLRTPYDYAHFDVIVYDQLRSPVLWVEENPDKHPRGRSRIIPAEHVHAVLEVKASLTLASARAASDKLHQLDALMAEIDPPGSPYPTFLPASTVLGVVFFEVHKVNERDLTALDTLRDLSKLARAFYGAIALSGEGRPEDEAAGIRMTTSEEPFAGMVPTDHTLLSSSYLTATTPHAGAHLGAMLTWSEVECSDFAFDLLAIMEGRYRVGFASSFHGLDLSRLPGA
jgi:hypothetical protein